MLLALWPSLTTLFKAPTPPLVAAAPRETFGGRKVTPRRLIGQNKLRDDDALLILLI